MFDAMATLVTLRSAPRVYLAGPDVFLPDADARFEAMEARCRALGLVGVRPSDGGLSAGEPLPGSAMAQRIYEGNVALIRRCDAIVAHLLPFRGPVEPDSGTAFELGVAVALGKPAAAYLPEPGTPYAERVRRSLPTRRDAEGRLWCEAQGMLVEGFGEPLNLMLSRSTALFAAFDDAIEHLARTLAPRPAPQPGA
ncbi:MAG TPA: nucleoside 2-deoxyribosyltransferase [Burkholderiaceae bacterium]|nr:nucleoside 2-deoxyribosyltransferase [Burkholderiaceae bacterium]